ncbi:MAG TPA: DUF1673 family protein [Methanosarcinaceae archaeon]|nr:DUF1673 family protein [Methanosarcinaceae archaeon]
MAEFIDCVKRMMGWCPNATPARYRSMQPVNFEYTSQTPFRQSNAENVQSKNVMFPANSSVFNIVIVIVLTQVLILSRNMDYAILIPILVGMYSLFYFLVVKTFQSNISIDENGIHLRSFELRNITLKYNDIRSVTQNKPIRSIEIITLFAIILTILAALLAYSVIIYGEWQLIISVAPLLPGYLLLKHKQIKKYHDLDTRLDIQSENKNRYARWYELTSNYSIVTDEMTASGIQAAIEHYKGVQ